LRHIFVNFPGVFELAAKILPVTEARRKFTEIIKNVEGLLEQYVITRKGKPAAIILSAEEYERITDAIRVMQDRSLQKKLQQAREDVHEGEVYSYEEIFGEAP
jgi:antitoxin YefM